MGKKRAGSCSRVAVGRRVTRARTWSPPRASGTGEFDLPFIQTQNRILCTTHSANSCPSSYPQLSPGWLHAGARGHRRAGCQDAAEPANPGRGKGAQSVQSQRCSSSARARGEQARNNSHPRHARSDRWQKLAAQGKAETPLDFKISTGVCARWHRRQVARADAATNLLPGAACLPARSSPTRGHCLGHRPRRAPGRSPRAGPADTWPQHAVSAHPRSREPEGVPAAALAPSCNSRQARALSGAVSWQMWPRGSPQGHSHPARGGTGGCQLTQGRAVRTSDN